jgi:hypothetical protein
LGLGQKGCDDSVPDDWPPAAARVNAGCMGLFVDFFWFFAPRCLPLRQRHRLGKDAFVLISSVSASARRAWLSRISASIWCGGIDPKVTPQREGSQLRSTSLKTLSTKSVARR